MCTVDGGLHYSSALFLPLFLYDTMSEAADSNPASRNLVIYYSAGVGSGARR